ncbi:hypothetical protein [Kingella denitrificans]|uniref:hypothetical protein n=1 Tax=Kingella denitrificans TaxID=502 RepID=UPI00030C2020|nr:hypothetical protein [Kingella denitrificans]QQB42342.1 hypothetical protein I6I17_01915 [Kingella denitrificans]
MKIAMIRRWLALMYYLYALRLAALSHFYFNPLYCNGIARRYGKQPALLPPPKTTFTAHFTL